MALGMALAFALGPVPSALARSSAPAHATLAPAHAASVPVHATPAPAHLAPLSSARPPAKNLPVAHAAGHKIA
jgi:hypothetical protein